MIKSIKGLIRPFRNEFDPEEARTRARLCEAFELLEDNLNSITSSGSVGKNYSKIYSSVPITTVTAVPLAIPFNSISSQNGGMHSNTTQNTRITIQRAGIYDISANVQWPAFAVAAIPLTLQVKVNGAVIIGSRIDYSQAAPLIQDQQVYASDYFNIGDYIEIFVTQTSGGNLIIPAIAAYSPYCMVKEN